MRWIKRLALALAALVAVLLLVAAILVRRQVPGARTEPIAELKSEASVSMDARGVPTIKAADLLDAFRVQGFETARERLFQMELMRRSAEGRLSELVGAGALPLDKVHRTYGFKQVAEAAVPLLPTSEREALEAYAAGVNAYIVSHPGQWGIEFQLLRFKPAPWTAAHSLEVLLLMHEDLSTSWKAEIQAEALKDLPDATQRFLMPRIAEGDLPLTPDLPGTVPDTAAFFRQHDVKAAGLDRSRELRLSSSPDASKNRKSKIENRKSDALQGMPLLAAAAAIPTPDPDHRAGSNNWVIAGSRTATGKPILANDPHLNLAAPGIWFAVRFETGSRRAQGVALPGLPGLVIGHNDAIAWGFTNLGTDVQDLYREPATGERMELIPVKGKPAVAFRVPLGAHGPQVLPGLSLKWTALDPSLLRMPTTGFMAAKDWASFNAAVDQFTGPAQNIVYADTSGHIGWRASGLIPIRKQGNDGSRILDGADPSNDWEGFVAPVEMPRILDPSEGFIATANNRVIGTSFPHVVATEWAGTSRAGRITTILKEGISFNPKHIDSMQLDSASDFQNTFNELLALCRASPLHEHQGGKARLQVEVNPEASETKFTRLDMHRRAFRKLLLFKSSAANAFVLVKYRWYNEDAWMLAAAKATPEEWKSAGLGDKQAFLDSCLAEAKASANWNKPWGEVNEVRMKHPIGLGGGILGWIFNPKPARISGSNKSIRVVSREFGQSMRMVVDMADLDATRLVLSLGQSGHLGSKNRLDQYADWQQGDPEGKRTRLHQAAVGSRVFRP